MEEGEVPEAVPVPSEVPDVIVIDSDGPESPTNPEEAWNIDFPSQNFKTVGADIAREVNHAQIRRSSAPNSGSKFPPWRNDTSSRFFRPAYHAKHEFLPTYPDDLAPQHSVYVSEPPPPLRFRHQPRGVHDYNMGEPTNLPSPTKYDTRRSVHPSQPVWQRGQRKFDHRDNYPGHHFSKRRNFGAPLKQSPEFPHYPKRQQYHERPRDPRDRSPIRKRRHPDKESPTISRPNKRRKNLRVQKATARNKKVSEKIQESKNVSAKCGIIEEPGGNGEENVESATPSLTPDRKEGIPEATTDDELLRIETDGVEEPQGQKNSAYVEKEHSTNDSPSAGQSVEQSGSEAADVTSPQLDVFGSSEESFEVDNESENHSQTTENTDEPEPDAVPEESDTENISPPTKPKQKGVLDLKALREAAFRTLKRKDAASNAGTNPSKNEEAFNLICEVEESSDDDDSVDEGIETGQSDADDERLTENVDLGHDENPQAESIQNANAKEQGLKQIDALKKKEEELKERLALLKVSKFSPFTGNSKTAGPASSPFLTKRLSGHRKGSSADAVLETAQNVENESDVGKSQTLSREQERELLMRRILAIEGKRASIQSDIDNGNKSVLQNNVRNVKTASLHHLPRKDFRSHLGSTGHYRSTSLNALSAGNCQMVGNVNQTTLKAHPRSVSVGIRAAEAGINSERGRNVQITLTRENGNFEEASNVASRAELNFLSASARLTAARTHAKLLADALESASAQVRKCEEDVSTANKILQSARNAVHRHSNFSCDADGSVENPEKTLLPTTPPNNRAEDEVLAKNKSPTKEMDPIVKKPSALSSGAQMFISPMAALRSYRLHLAWKGSLGESIFSPTWSHNLDPAKIICRFELHGRCSKLDCDSQHLRDTCRVSPKKVLHEFQEYFGPAANSPDLSTLEKAGSAHEGGGGPQAEKAAGSIARAYVKRLVEEANDTHLPLSPPSPL